MYSNVPEIRPCLMPETHGIRRAETLHFPRMRSLASAIEPQSDDAKGCLPFEIKSAAWYEFFSGVRLAADLNP